MKKFVIQVVILLLVIGGGMFFLNPNVQVPTFPFLPQQPRFKEVMINDQKLKVEIADTQEKRSRGLGGRESLASDSGMLFIFPKPDKYPFWMKGLKFPLDFIYIREDKVIDLLPNIQPPSGGATDESLPIYLPREEVDKVLEVGGGTIEKFGIKVGDSIKLN